MTTMPVRKNLAESGLMTPDPYHTPGYCGFCPQFKFKIGETFGCTTSRLLTDPKNARSDRPVLGSIAPAPGPESPGVDYATQRAQQIQLLKEREKARFGDKKLGTKMVPGYTGYIPKGQHYYGSPYGEIALRAISDFEQDFRAHSDKRKKMERLRMLQEGLSEMTEEEKKTLNIRRNPEPVMQEIGPLFYLQSNQYSISPYYMGNDNPRKRFVSGYTGFVPKSRGLIGMGYPVLTNLALIDFTNNSSQAISRSKGKARKDRETVKLPISAPRRSSMDKQKLPIIYPLDSGLVPHYTGHIPGQKFRYGTTFGHSTKNAKREPADLPTVALGKS